MPPIPVALSEGISQQISSARRRQNDLVEFQIPRLRSCKGPLSVQQNLATELREDIDSFSKQVEALDILVGDQKGERARAELRRVVDEFQDALLGLRKESRAALLASKRTIDSQSKSQRDELLTSSAVTEKWDGNEKATDDVLMKANNDVTEALRRTINLMQGELERSVLSSQMLDASTANLRSTSSTHDTLTSVMGTSKQLITALEKSDWLDRVLILSAFMFFILVVLFIVKQRILDRGIRVAFWWTRFLPDFSKDADLLKMEKGGVGSSTMSVVVSSTSSALSTTAVTALTGSTSLSIPLGGSAILENEDRSTTSMTGSVSITSELTMSTLDPFHVEL